MMALAPVGPAGPWLRSGRARLQDCTAWLGSHLFTYWKSLWGAVGRDGGALAEKLEPGRQHDQRREPPACSTHAYDPWQFLTICKSWAWHTIQSLLASRALKIICLYLKSTLDPSNFRPITFEQVSPAPLCVNLCANFACWLRLQADHGRPL
jgi:hypothetical protein